MADNPLAGIIQQVDRDGHQINNFTDIGAPGGEFPPQKPFEKGLPSANVSRNSRTRMLSLCTSRLGVHLQGEYPVTLSDGILRPHL